jgi:ABC-type multidrug transport system ATPase subunit
MSRAQHPSIKVAQRILRELEKLPIETQRTILHFVHQSTEEAFVESQQIGLSDLGQKVADEAVARMNATSGPATGA